MAWSILCCYVIIIVSEPTLRGHYWLHQAFLDSEVEQSHLEACLSCYLVNQEQILMAGALDGWL